MASNLIKVAEFRVPETAATRKPAPDISFNKIEPVIFAGRGQKLASSGRFLLPLWPLGLARFFFGSLGGTNEFYDQLQIFVIAGMPFQEAIGEMRDDAVERKQKSKYQAMSDIYGRLESGEKLVDAMRNWFPGLEILLIAGGAQSPKTMPEAIARIITMKRGMREARSTLFAMMMDPLMIFGGTYAIVFWTATIYYNKITRLAQGLKPSQLHGTARQLYYAGVFGDSIWVYLIPVLLLIIGGITLWSMPRWTGKIRKFMDNFPPYSTYKSIQGAAWMQAFSIMTQTTTSYKEVISDMADVSNPWMAERLNAITDCMVLSLGEAMCDSGYYFPDVNICKNLKRIGARKGISESLDRIGQIWFQKLIGGMKSSASMLSTVTMLVSTLGMAWSFMSANALIEQVVQIVKSKYSG
jgi:type II secretory pathway component PulF